MDRVMRASFASQSRLRFQRLRVLFALIVREMSAKFGRSWGGYLWAVAEPLGGIVLLALVFSVAVRDPPIGSSFMFFYATGIIPFFLFNGVARTVAGAVSSNKGLLTYPAVTVLDTIFAKFLLEMLTMVVVSGVLFAGIVFVEGVYVNFRPEAVVLSLAMAGLIGLGVGTINCLLFGFFPTWKNVWAVLTRPLFLVSGVIFTFDLVPAAFQKVLWFNPVVHAIGTMRAGFYGGYRADYVSVPYVVGLSLGLFVTGAWLVRRHASFLIEQ